MAGALLHRLTDASILAHGNDAIKHGLIRHALFLYDSDTSSRLNHLRPQASEIGRKRKTSRAKNAGQAT
jgi:hypothetical protein